MMSSLYIGATGMKSLGDGIGVISQNLSNINTLGYKQLSIEYSDLMSKYMTASSGNITNTSQQGLGAAPGSVRTLFTQGGLETASSNTDLSINGEGFFGVTQNGQMHYTRAGDFRFDNQGALLDASGWNLVGKRIVNGAVQSETEGIRLDMGAGGIGKINSRASTMVSVASDLGGLERTSDVEGNPFFSLASSWDGTSSTPLANGSYSHSEPVQFYDNEGNLCNATLYYNLAGKSNGNTAVEYVLGMPPNQDGSALAGSGAAGLLMAGTLTFDSTGSMTNMTAFSPPASGDPSDLSGWTPAALQGGKPVFSAKIGGQEALSIGLDMGLALGSAGAGAGLASAAEAAANPGSIYGTSADAERSDIASTMSGTSPSSISSTRDGFGEGSLKDVTVGKDGIVKGIYSNGQEEDLYQLSLFRFVSKDGLRHEGGNHYSATPDSGPAGEGVPTEENFGGISSQSIEQSNVDYAREFSLLIVTQRGFQMNSKIVTTSDAMLQKALELKR